MGGSCCNDLGAMSSITTNITQHPPFAPNRGDGRGRVYIETYGCTFNVSDSEAMAGLLAAAGFEIVASEAEADVVVVNSCIVKDRSYWDLRKRLGGLCARRDREGGPVVVLAGCAPRVPAHGREFAALPQLGPDNVASVVEVVERALRGEIVHRTERRPEPARVALPKRRRNPAIEIIPISKGCLGACTFCQTVLARGRLYSFDEEQILDAIRAAVSEGVRQIWLTSQDCGAYGRDRDTTLPKLLRRIAEMPGDFRVRLGMVNPDWAKLYAEELAEIYAHPRFYAFAHLPVQSGSDAVLQAMRRNYSARDFEEVCEVLRRRVPEIAIATDIIAGFPTERDHDWEQTVALLRRVRPAVVNRSRFSPRPGTAAARLSPLPSAVVGQRSRELADLTLALTQERLRHRVGDLCEVVVEEQARPGSVVARDRCYTSIIVEGSWPLGSRLSVRLTRVERFHLRAEVVCHSHGESAELAACTVERG
ncbi:MAG: tRNA (N(6)-L-threonylcarbamoyladenosine(37)-C(2))-methylthiotransferase [Candidatus Hydrogenedentota bacterium]|uniref:tRNA (N(6)-L-threonylcarbamoyladenosine(37)-C(2))-methylthiotransferase n=1 Tax=Sumerlaea chitinivorans TaxID=2250252 RepID=A0A2Z4Y7P7_SUMC1|nr:hypothetical protein BRCON_2269 [Candidatus Sumerlaea chitinivorans]RMH24922.1 MAG: tRNA (N(6)-L-threonylcarbamoyladenosine(37)-C(2))-methylthiotransferase [Candidatus Hydrogenedentota bacterium]